jgi:hypothetical protein
MNSFFFQVHLVGGVEWMTPITLLLLIAIGIIFYIVFSRIKKRDVSPRLLESLRHVGGAAAAYGTLGTLVGFFAAFNALASSAEIIGFQIIMGGLKVALMTVIYGLIVFCISLMAYVVLKATARA